ncbi:MAG: hypothetical protein FWG98_02230 [Candidatus Cloacimonetes bacterium]|nr:hypothetical protein [Candidatus Cloacimonadota bacterium]
MEYTKLHKNLKISMIIIVIIILVVAISCTNHPTNQHEAEEWTKGDLKAILHQDVVGNLLNNFLQDYAEWNLEITAHLLPDNYMRLTFMTKTQDEKLLLELLENDKRIQRISKNEDNLTWISGLISGSLHINSSTTEILIFIKQMLSLYSKYELVSNIPTRVERGAFEFSFNNKLIDDFEMLLLIRDDFRVKFADIPIVHLDNENETWVKGEIVARINARGFGWAEEIKYSYSDFETSILSFNKMVESVHFSFNYDLIDEFEFLEMLRNDPLIMRADFNEYPRDWVIGELIIKMEDELSNEILDGFPDIFMKYQMTLMGHNIQSKNLWVTFNHYLINELELLEMVNNHPWVLNADFNRVQRHWKMGQFSALLEYHVFWEELDDFIESYNEYELIVLSKNYWTNTATLSFNIEIINEYEMLDILNNDPRILWVAFIPFVDLWN